MAHFHSLRRSKPACRSVNGRLRLSPLVEALALAFVGLASAPAPAQTPAQLGGAWFAVPQSVNASRAARATEPAGVDLGRDAATLRQQQAARQTLQSSVDNLERTAAAIAAQQAAQKAARAAAAQAPAGVPDGLVPGGLWDRDATGAVLPWSGAERAVQTTGEGKTQVTVKQTRSKAILNWDSFNVGRNTTLDFQQNSTDAVLNRVSGGDARPSQILGAIKGNGTVMVINQNGIIFTGTSQVNVRNLVAAAGKLEDEQFRERGLYGANRTVPSITAAKGSVEVRAGAQLVTHAPASSTSGGGYVLLLGANVTQAGQIVTPAGQTVLAAGDNFYIRKGVGTDSNLTATTAGHEVSTDRLPGSAAGRVANSGLILAGTGDVTLTGHELLQAGVIVATTSTAKRGTIHLSTRSSDSTGAVTLAGGAVTAILLDSGNATALDSQREAGFKQLGSRSANDPAGVFDNLGTIADRTDLSRIEIVSGNTVAFQDGSLTLATGGEMAVTAVRRTLIEDGAALDVSGAIGVRVAMESNALNINVQGNEQRDSPGNREGKTLTNSDLWVDRRRLVYVPAGTNGYATERWYTAGGLLEVGGYLATRGSSIGEWMAQGGSITVNGGDLVTRSASRINLSGGTLDVQSGRIRQSWLKGSDGRLYEVSSAPGDLLYSGIYQGYALGSKRWGHTDYYFNPLIGAPERYEQGYTIGRDAGKLVVATANAVLDGTLLGAVYQGEVQTRAPQPGLDGFAQSQLAVARAGQLVIGRYTPLFDSAAGVLRYALAPQLEHVALTAGAPALAAGVTLDGAVDARRRGQLVLDAGSLTSMKLGAVRIAASRDIEVQGALQVAPGGDIVLYAPQVDIKADLVARSGTLRVGNVLAQPGFDGTTVKVMESGIAIPVDGQGGIRVREGARLDARGLVSDLSAGGADVSAYVDGGTLSLRSTASVTVEHDAILDVSSGGVVRADGSVAGGRGGSVQLGAGLDSTGQGDPFAVLTLDGGLRGAGVKGGGTLDIESASAITIGGKRLDKDGLLDKGQSALADLILTREVNVPAGERLPMDAPYTVSWARPGEKIESAMLLDGVVLAAEWRIPYPPGSGIAAQLEIGYRLPGETFRRTIVVSPEGDANGVVYTLPAGATLLNGIREFKFSIDYVVPADVFPNGVAVTAHQRIAPAGTTLPFDVVIPRGTVVKAGTVVSQPVYVSAITALAPELFRQGFADYRVRGHHGLAVPDGVTLEVVQPLIAPDALRQMAQDPAGAVPAPWLPDRYLADAQTRKLSQRPGASLTLAGGMSNDLAKLGAPGNLYIGRGATLLVDPGQSIALSSRTNMMVDGTVSAPGGLISLLGPQKSVFAKTLEQGGLVADGSGAERAIVVGDHAVLDASAASGSARDALGRPYGVLGQGGRIVIGGSVLESASRALASDAFVVVRPGAVLDVSGGMARFDADGTGIRTVVSDGGSISLASASGLYLNGSLRAREGGAGASGGSLVVALDAPSYNKDTLKDLRVLALRELQLVQGKAAVAQGALDYGYAQLGTEQVAAGGFASLTVFSNGSLSLADRLDLTLGRELRLYSGALTVAGGAASTARASVSAPYVLLAGITDNWSREGFQRPSFQGGVGEAAPRAGLSATADLIDIKGDVTVGLNSKVAGTRFTRAGVGQLDLNSRGDIRFVAAPSDNPNWATQLLSPGNILLRAAQLYPATGVGARVLAGRNGENSYDPDGRLTIRRFDPQAGNASTPFSVFGRLTLGAATIEQQGVVRAPLGSITLGTDPYGLVKGTQAVTLASGSLTSVSAAGLVMPYGGTSDGIGYRYLGQPVTLAGVGTGPVITLSDGQVVVAMRPVITLSAGQLVVAAGAELDLSGGGELQGAGFIAGRGGSTDARYFPLMQNTGNGLVLPALSRNPVYAIVPGFSAAYAPADATGAVDPRIGQQLVLQSGEIPGLPAGRYTLLPSSYALLPGAFRVEVNGAPSGGMATTATSLRNGSYSAPGLFSVAGTGIVDSLASQLILTPADVLRRYSQYNETGYAEFIRAQAELNGGVRAVLPADAKNLAIRLSSSAGSELRFAGTANFTPGSGGYGGSASLATRQDSGAIEILGNDASATTGFNGASVHARDLEAIGAAQLLIGGSLSSSYSDGRKYQNLSHVLNIIPGTGTVILRNGALLRAPEVFLVASNPREGIVIERGAGISTVGKGKPAYDAANAYVYKPGDTSVVAASNGRIDMLPPVFEDRYNRGSGPISIGSCAGVCRGSTGLYAEGSLVAVTRAGFSMDDAVRYGARDLTLAVGAVNAGSNDALAAAAAQGALTPGLMLTQSVLNRLLQGDTANGAPALETLTLTASESFNVFGSVTLDTTDPLTGKSRLDTLVLSTPGIYGSGAAGDLATIKTHRLTWAGTGSAAPAPVTNGRGSGAGRLAIDADVIEFGYGPKGRPNGVDDASRTVLGFSDVLFNASERITANQQGSLNVYAAQTATPEGLRYSGGNLVLSTPLLTGAGGSVNRISAGGMVRVTAPGGRAATATGDVQTGAELSLSGDSVTLDTTVALPSGKLTVKAERDVVLGNAAWLDLAGREIALFDTRRYTWGGDVVLQSHAGSITQATGSRIDLSAVNHHGGLLTAIALDDEHGRVDLQGTLQGRASGQYDAGGTLVPWRAGGVVIRSAALGSGGSQSEAFATLNRRLNEGGVTGERSFQFRRGDLEVGDGLRGHEINLSLDGGRLTVTGTIDAGGEQVGSIRLAARSGITVAGTARLDAHGTQLRLDSRGLIIDAPNRAVIELDAGLGTLMLADGASFDLRHATNDARVQANPALSDGRARGTLDLIAPRIDAAGQVGTVAAADYGDIAIDTGRRLDIQGAGSISVYGRQSYQDAPFNDESKGERAPGGRPYQIVTQSYLDTRHEASERFVNAALANTTLLNTRLAGLTTGYGTQLHLRPALEIVSAQPGGDMIVSGDVDLSGFRYASLNPSSRKTGVPGSGEPGTLTIRAGGDLSILGSISDGFATPPATPDDNGWWLVPGEEPFRGDVVIPVPGVTLAEGTVYPAGKTLNYAITARNVTLPAGTVLPVAIVLPAALTLPAGTVLAADALAADGSVLLAKGTVVGASGMVLPDGARLQAGVRLPVAVALASLTWPKGVALPVAMTQQGSLVLPVGAVIASGTTVVMPTDVVGVDLRPRDGSGHVIERHNWAVAAMLPEGASSWNLQLAAGADTAAADRRLTRADGSGNVVLADTHYTAEIYSDMVDGVLQTTVTPKSPVFSVLRTGTGDLTIAAAGNLAMKSPYGVYTAGTQTRLGDATLDAAFNPERGKVADGGTVLGLNAGDQAEKYEALVNGSARLDQAWYPDGGGNLHVTAGGDLTGDSWGGAVLYRARASAGTGNWLWRQGGNGRPVAWWINFGSYTFDPRTPLSLWPAVTGFTGLGTLGGGNATVRVAGDAGMIERRSVDTADYEEIWRSQGIVLGVGSSGRVLDNGRTVLTGGGDLDLRIGGGWNSHEEARLSHSNNMIIGTQTHELYGGLVNLRGAVDMAAGQIGTMHLYYSANTKAQDAREVRLANLDRSSQSFASGGLMLTPGDAVFSVASRGDLVLGGTSDAGLAWTGRYLPFAAEGGAGENAQSWFSLWTKRTAVDLLASGGNLAFDTRASEFQNGPMRPGYTYMPNGGWFLLPGRISAAAVQGSLYYGQSAAYSATGGSLWNNGGLLQVPLGEQGLELLAGGSLYGSGYAISRSGADASALATITQPAWAGGVGVDIISNASPYAPPKGEGDNPLFAFGLNSLGAEAGVSHDMLPPARFYALHGDIVGLRIGTVARFTSGGRIGQTDYVAAGPVALRAGRDIVYSGTRADETPLLLSDFFKDGWATVSGNLIVHTHANDVSVIEAGRDILYANVSVAGPGTLEISAGRHIVQNDLAALRSLGPLAVGDTRPGAGITVLAGLGASGADYSGLLSRYLDAANVALSGRPLAEQPGKVAKTYGTELLAWLQAHYGFTGSLDEAGRYLAALPPEQQRIFAREVFFAELRAGGREYNEVNGPRQGSYLRGRMAIAALFPTQDAQGKPRGYDGDLRIYGGAGIHTDVGGDIRILTPGGSQTYGIEGEAPPASAGLITRGQGDIQLYSQDSILLGQSRIMTTFGGDILAWSARGDINAGRGSKTTVVYTPPRRVYDQVGNVTLSPDVPSTGAGIATLNPIPEVTPGDVDLIAPLGTIDAGEAGIRVSGNVNVAALQVVNAANIQVQGKSAGVPVMASVNIGAQTSASAATSSATQAAGEVVRRQQAAARQNQASLISVQVLGFGNESL